MLLAQLQSELLELIHADKPLDSDIIQPIHHLAIHRNNIKASLQNALRETYPLINKIIGNDFFDYTAKIYRQRYPSRSGNLSDYGEHFADFLTAFEPVKDLIYLPEIAKFEWASHCLYFAAEHTCHFDANALTSLPTEQYDQICFDLHPALQLIQFHFPILRIIDLCKGIIDETIDINEGGVYLLMVRKGTHLTLTPLDAGAFTALSSIKAGHSLSFAIHAALRVDPHFELDKALIHWMQIGIIIDYHLNKP